MADELKVDTLHQADREFFLGLYRAAVKYYQPKIEAKTGKQLGTISVWDSDRLCDHRFEEYIRQTYWWPMRLLQSKLLRPAWNSGFKKVAYNRATQYTACYFNSGIYISFVSASPHETLIATTTVHELSHALWEQLANESLGGSRQRAEKHGEQRLKEYEFFIEGFATYAEREYFREIYARPIHTTSPHHIFDINTSYERGFRLAKKLIKEHGPDIFLQIPKRWESLISS